MKTSTKVIIGSGIVGVAVVLYFMLQTTSTLDEDLLAGDKDLDSSFMDDELLNDNQPTRRGGRSNRDGNYSRGETIRGNPRRSTKNSGTARMRYSREEDEYAR